jgi:uncharacterized membrane protein
MNPWPTILAISFWVHLIGITIWVGGSFLLPLAIQPALATLEGPSRMKSIMAISMRMMPLFTISIVLTFLSGFLQSWIIFRWNWPIILSIKFFVAVLMMANGVYVGVVLTRRVGALAPASGAPPSPEFLKAQRLLGMHSWIQAGLAVVVLLLVGFLTAS